MTYFCKYLLQNFTKNVSTPTFTKNRLKMHLFSQNTPSGYTTCNAHNLQYDNVITYICTFTLAKDK